MSRFIPGWVILTFLLTPAGFAEEDALKTLKAQVAVLHREGRTSEAVPLAANALKDAEDPESSTHADLPRYLEILAKLHTLQGHPQEAEPLYKRALMIRKSTKGSTNNEVAKTLGSLAAAYTAQKKYGEAIEVLKEKIALLEKIHGPDHAKLKEDKKFLGDLVFQAKLDSLE